MEKPSKNYIINHNTVLKKTKHGATVYIGDPKDIMENYINKSQKSKNDNIHHQKIACKRYFCYFCLKGSYDIIVDQVKYKKDFCCPFCVGTCFCTRCIRYEQILKLSTFYISLEGEIPDLIDFLMKKSNILERLEASLILNKISIINIFKNEKNTIKPNASKSNLLKGYTQDYKQNLYNDLIKKREELEKKKIEADSFFNRCLYDKAIVNVHSKFIDLESSLKLDKLHFLNLRDSKNNSKLDISEYKFLKKKTMKTHSASTSTTHDDKQGRKWNRLTRKNGVEKNNRLRKRKSLNENTLKYNS